MNHHRQFKFTGVTTDLVDYIKQCNLQGIGHCMARYNFDPGTGILKAHLRPAEPTITDREFFGYLSGVLRAFSIQSTPPPVLTADEDPTDPPPDPDPGDDGTEINGIWQ